MLEEKKENFKQPKKATKQISAGLIVYRRTKKGLKFLLLYRDFGYWNFPKGKIEQGEKNFDTAVRETQEETGIPRKQLRVLNGFRAQEKYSFRGSGKKILKTVFFFLAESSTAHVNISLREHQGYGWFLYRDAKQLLAKHKDSQGVLNSANNFLKKMAQRSRFTEKKVLGLPQK